MRFECNDIFIDDVDCQLLRVLPIKRCNRGRRRKRIYSEKIALAHLHLAKREMSARAPQCQKIRVNDSWPALTKYRDFFFFLFVVSAIALFDCVPSIRNIGYYSSCRRVQYTLYATRWRDDGHTERD